MMCGDLKMADEFSVFTLALCDLVSDALPSSRLWYGEPNAIENAVGYAQRAILQPRGECNAVSFSSARTFSRSPKSNRASCASASVTAQDDSYTRVTRYQVLP